MPLTAADDTEPAWSGCRCGRLLAEADVVTLHARVTRRRPGSSAADQFAAMKDGAIFVNTARGPLVDYDALYAALAEGRLAGAMLETFAVEPVPADWPLLRLPNVTLTPHIAGASAKTQLRRGGRGRGSAPPPGGEPPLNPC